MSFFEYSFPDEIVESFLYDSKNNLIEISFESYSRNGDFIETPCKLVIKDWVQANSKLHNAKEYGPLESCLGVISLILSITSDKERVCIVANTIDDKYIDLLFTNPYIYVETLS
ncbi:hypothetical protein ELR70_04270 [Pseudoalteromonas sp. R3]|nr:hypothetical protein ELR70_04270 [Pseudoalteromonas sp. R3]